MPAGQQAVPEVRGRENHGAAHGEKAVRNDAQAAVSNRRAGNEQTESRDRGEHDTRIAMPCIPDTDRDDAQRNDEKQHLCVQVAFGEWHQHWQGAHEKRQREAVHQAQAGEPDCGAVEPVGRFRGCLIHWGMPLCWCDAHRVLQKRNDIV